MEIEFFRTSSGREPAREFIQTLDVKLQARVVRTIHLLAANGIALREPFSKALGNGIFELRTRLATSSVRVLYFFYHGDKAILTNGFIKKTWQVPTGEIERAIRYRDDYLKRNAEA